MPGGIGTHPSPNLYYTCNEDKIIRNYTSSKCLQLIDAIQKFEKQVWNETNITGTIRADWWEH